MADGRAASVKLNCLKADFLSFNLLGGEETPGGGVDVSRGKEDWTALGRRLSSRSGLAPPSHSNQTPTASSSISSNTAVAEDGEEPFDLGLILRVGSQLVQD